MKCEKCGTEMVGFKENYSCGLKCPNCGWGVVTTFAEPIFSDRTVYKLEIVAEGSVEKEKLKAISKVFECNFLKAKKILEDGGAFKSGNAVEIASFAKNLRDAGVQFEIFPEFNYKY